MELEKHKTVQCKKKSTLHNLTFSWLPAAQASEVQPCTVSKQTNVVLYLNPATTAGRRFFPFLGTTPSYHTEVTPIVLCTAQCTPSVLWQCYHENNTINPLSFQPLCMLCFQVLLGRVPLGDRPASKNDQIIPSHSSIHCGLIYLGQLLLQL